MKKILPLIFVLILLSSSVLAINTGDVDILGYWRGNETSGNLADTKTNSRQDFSVKLTSGAAGYRNPPVVNWSEFSFDLPGGIWFRNTSTDAKALDDSWDSSGYTYMASYRNDRSFATTEHRYIVSTRTSSLGASCWLHFGVSHLYCTDHTSGVNIIYNAATQVVGYNYSVVYSYNTTHALMWLKINNGAPIVVTPVAMTSYTPADIGISIGGYAPTASFYGDISDVIIMNRSVTQEEAFGYLNSGLQEVLVTSTATPTIQPPSPEDNANNNTNVTLNVSHSTINNDVRYYLYFGLNNPLTEADLIYDNVTRNASEYSTWTTNVAVDGTYFWKWRVQNTTDGIFSENTTQRTWTLDTTDPTITLQANNTFNASDISTTNQYLDFFVIGIIIEDETELDSFLINITKDGKSVFNFTNESLVGLTTYNFSRNLSTATWGAGVYDIEVSASDAHTTNSINNYNVNNGINTIIFNTAEGNEIKISTDGSAYSTLHEKKKDRYLFGFNYLFSDDKRKFTLESDSPIIYHPNSKYIGHFTVGGLRGNWIDFEGIGKDYSVKRVNDYKYEITFINLAPTTKIISRSIGGVNIITQTFKWYKGNFSVIAPSITTFGNIETFVLNISRNTSFVTPTASFSFDDVIYETTSTFNDDYITFSRILNIPQPSGASENVSFFWDVNITQSDSSLYSFKISQSINISESLLDNCSAYNRTVLIIFGKDEETDIDVNTSLNILFIPKIDQTGINNSYELRNKHNYSFCSDSEENFTLDSIMEYGGDDPYTIRKYYLNNFSIDTSTVNEVILYHLNNSKASEIVFTVFDRTTGNRIPDAFIKILRFYPGEDVLRVVEIAKTDETGQSLGKMVLADVFYKFIIEVPAGTVKLDTGVLRILSLTRSFGISFVEDILDTWDKIHGVSTLVSCTKGTQTCRITWSDESNILQDAKLEVWRTSGFQDVLLFSQTTSSAAGTISYTITEDTLGNVYTAKGFIESNTGTSTYGSGIASLIYPDNPFFTDSTQRLASIFPLFLFAVVMIFVLIDFGVIGVVIGALLVLVTGSITSILPLSPFFLEFVYVFSHNFYILVFVYILLNKLSIVVFFDIYFYSFSILVFYYIFSYIFYDTL